MQKPERSPLEVRWHIYEQKKEELIKAGLPLKELQKQIRKVVRDLRL